MNYDSYKMYTFCQYFQVHQLSAYLDLSPNDIYKLITQVNESLRKIYAGNFPKPVHFQTPPRSLDADLEFNSQFYHLAELVSIVFLGRYALELYSHKNPPRIIPALEKDNYQKGVDAVFIDTGTETQERVIVGAIDFTSSIRKFLGDTRLNRENFIAQAYSGKDLQTLVTLFGPLSQRISEVKKAIWYVNPKITKIILKLSLDRGIIGEDGTFNVKQFDEEFPEIKHEILSEFRRLALPKEVIFGARDKRFYILGKEEGKSFTKTDGPGKHPMYQPSVTFNTINFD